MTDLVRYFQTTVTLAVTLCAASLVVAQDLEPRSYTNVPIGETFLVAGYVRSSGDVAPSGADSPLQDLELTINALGLGFARSFELAGSSAKIDVGVSRLCFEDVYSRQKFPRRRPNFQRPTLVVKPQSRRERCQPCWEKDRQ